MTISVTHAKVLTIPNDVPPAVVGEVQPTDWNDTHTITGAVPDTRQIIAGTGLTGGGTLAADRTLTLDATKIRTTKHLKFDYGLACDGTTDDTTAFNVAIAAANAASGGWVFVVPVRASNSVPSILLSGAPTAIVVNNVWFIGEGTAQDCIIKTTNDQGLKWSTTATSVDGGGLLNVGLDSDGTSTRVSLVLPRAQRMRFDTNYVGSGVATLAQLGSSASSTTSAEATFSRTRGIPADVGVPLFDVQNGSGFFLQEFDLFTPALAGAATAGRHFVSVTGGNWDTIIIRDGLAQRFDAALNINSATGKVIQNIIVTDCFFDGMRQGIVGSATGNIYALEVIDNEITGSASGGIGVNLSGAGTIHSTKIHGNRILECNKDGIAIPASAVIYSIQNNTIYGVNQAVGAFNGITVATGATSGIIAGNNVGVDVSGFSGAISGTPQTGISIGTVTGIQVIGNKANGSSAGFSFGVLTTATARNNQGFTAGVADVTGVDRGTITTNNAGDTTASTTATGSISVPGGIAAAKQIWGKTVSAQKDVAGVTDYHIGAIGASDPNQQVWFTYDTTNERGFMQAIKQGTGNKPLLLNPLGANVIIGAQSNGIFGLDHTGTLGVTGNATIKYGTAIPAGGTQDAGYLFSSTAHFGIIYGSGVPTASMAQGTAYIRSDGGSLSSFYVNTNGTTGYAALPFASTVGLLRFAITGVNFNSANTDNSVTISLPAGITRWRVNAPFITNASASISTATAGIFTGAGGTGQTIAANQAITVTATAADTNNNMMVMAATNGSTMAYNDTTIFFRIGTAQGSAATADFVLDINVLT